ncbi:hypothetical protein BDR06DRAFT_982503 [Suillus hirtellus]|nr:hypothetical protein BDR06DRAFT_982503 [Suillus hirtellus]
MPPDRCAAGMLVAGLTSTLDPDEALRIRRKIDGHNMPLMYVAHRVQFMDKTTLCSAAILGIHDLGFEYPQNLALQRFTVGKGRVAPACYVACKNFAGLLVVRLLLGVCEGSITAGFLITLRVGYWSQIISGFISFGTLHINTKGFQPWQWSGIPFFIPHINIARMIDALTDPKTWLFTLFSQALILASFGFSALQTTLLSCVPGIIEILTVFTGVRLAAQRSNSRAYVGAIYFVPAWLGILLVNLLPWSNRTGLLISRYMTVVSVPGFCLTAGHTKKIVTNAIILSTQYKPRLAHVTSYPVLLLIIRAVLPVDDGGGYAIERITEDGKRSEVNVEKEFLDLTDKQNRNFRYVL